MANEPVWKRVVGGVIGLAIAVALLIYFRPSGASGESIGQGETAIVVAAGAAAAMLWFIKRRR